VIEMTTDDIIAEDTEEKYQERILNLKKHMINTFGSDLMFDMFLNLAFMMIDDHLVDKNYDDSECYVYKDYKHLEEKYLRKVAKD